MIAILSWLTVDFFFAAPDINASRCVRFRCRFR